MESGTSASLHRWLVTLASGAMTSLDHTMVGDGEGTGRPVMGRSIAVLVVALLVMSVIAACGGDSGEEIVEVSFDGSECIVAGATEVPPEDYAFLLTDVSGLDLVTLYAYKLVDGHTFQDVLDWEKEAGGPGSPWPGEPSWFGHVIPFHSRDIELRDLADNQQLRAVSPEPGNYVLLVQARDSLGGFPTWLCAPLDVVES